MPWLTDDAVIRAIRSIDSVRFVALCNALLRVEAARLGIPLSHLNTNLNSTEPDGGLDASCESAPKHGGLLIPAADVGYQFRSGESRRSAKHIATHDILNKKKPRPREYLRAGRPIVFMTGAERGNRFEEQVRAAVRERIGDEFAFRDEQIIVLTAGRLANQVLAAPALAHCLGFGQEVPEDIKEWAARPTMANPFQKDAELEARIADLRAQIERPQSRVRLLGPAGSGKTRSVLEALRGSALASTVVYFEHPDRAGNFLHHVKRAPVVQCVAILDEMDEASAARILDEFRNISGDLRLVLVGRDAMEAVRADVLQAPTVSESVIAEIITSLAPGIPRDQAATAASACGKSPKFAVLVAEGLRLDPGLIVRERLLQDGTVQSKIDLLLPFKDDKDRDALAAIALLERLGWDDEARAESTALFEGVRLDPPDARGRVEMLHSRFGIAPLAGRYRYVSPELLGDHLATRFLSRWDTPDVERFIGALTPVMQDSFTRRLRRLGRALRNHKIVEEALFGERGPFRSLTQLEEASRGTALLSPRRGRPIRLLRNLSGAFPLSVLRAMRRLIGEASDAEISAATETRRDLVWTLGELLWMESTFEAASRLLLRLAVNENETWANNATGTWAETFQLRLGRTAAPPPARLRVLSSAAASDDVRVRLLAAKALASALKADHVSRVGNPPTDVPDMPKEAWDPRTYGEMADAVIGHLELLPRLLGDRVREVRLAAAEALANAVGNVFFLPRVADVFVRVARGLTGAEYELRQRVLDRIALEIKWRTKSEPKELDAETKAELERIGAAVQKLVHDIEGEDFRSRFRRAISTVAWKPEEVAELRKRIEVLIDEAVADPTLLDSEWSWLAESGARRATMWAELLGARDSKGVFEPTVREWALKDDATTWWLAAYDFGRLGTHNPDAIDRRAQELADTGYPPERVFDYILRMGPSEARLRQLIDLLARYPTVARQLRGLAYSQWRREMSWQRVVALGQAVHLRAEDAPGLLALLTESLESTDEVPAAARPLALHLLELTADANGDLDADEWETLATKLIAADPERVARIAVERVLAERRSLGGGHDPVNVLDHAWAACNQRAFFAGVIAPTLLGKNERAWALLSALQQMPLRIEALGADYLLDWVASEPRPRAFLLAHAIGRPRHPMTDLEARLLERFDDYGVGSEYAAAFGSGTFAGSIADHIAGQLEQAKKWTDDMRPFVRDWGQRLVRQYEAELKYARREEEEERFD